jgi:hypothetical protein
VEEAVVNKKMIKRLIAGAMCVTLGAPACAGAARMQVTPVASDGRVLAEFVQKLPPGAAIRVDRTGGTTLRGTLMKASDQSMVVQPRTRIPEPAVEIPFSEVLRVTPDAQNGSSLGKAVGIGVAAGAGAALSVFMIIAAIFAGS